MLNVKVEIMKRGKKLTEIAAGLSQKRGKKVCYYSLTQRINKGTLKQTELEEIMELLDCKLIVVDATIR